MPPKRHQEKQFVHDVVARFRVHDVVALKNYSIPAKGYVDTIKQAGNVGIVSRELSLSLKPFFDFRNSLVHRYWAVDDRALLENCKTGHGDFSAFVEAIEKFLGSI